MIHTSSVRVEAPSASWSDRAMLLRFRCVLLFAWALVVALLWGCSSPSSDAAFLEPPDGGSEVANDAVPHRSVGGTVSGLTGAVVLLNNGTDPITVTKDGAFVFPALMAAGSRYAVTIASRPAEQACLVANGVGTIGSSDVTNVSVTCARDVYSVGGVVSGLTGTLVLRNNGGDDRTVTANGPFQFVSSLATGSRYSVTVRTQPIGQRCTITSGAGVIGSANIASVGVACIDVFTVGGTVSGLTGTLVLHNSGGDALSVSASGPFTFATPLATAAPYAVTIATQPVNQFCTLQNGTGTVGTANVTSVVVACVPTFAVGGTVSGLLAGAVVLQLNGGSNLSVIASGPFAFVPRLLDTAAYAVTVLASPPGQICTVSSGSGNVAGANVSGVAVICRAVSVAINEVYARTATGPYGDTNGDGARDSADDEFIEIINNEAFAVDLGDWVVRTGAGPTSVRYAFAANTLLGPGARAVVFGGGAPSGSFANALTFASGGLSLTDAPAASYLATLESAASGGFIVDTFTYDAATFGTSCTTACDSRVRNPEGTGAFVAHTTVSGSPGILWSPGVAASAAIPKVNTLLGIPAASATNVNVKTVLAVQLNMFATVADWSSANLKLFASTCVAPANEVTSFSSLAMGIDAAQARLVPSTDLAFGTTHCMSVAGTLRSANGVALAGAVTYQFTTRAAASVPAATVVISEYGGCRMGGTSGATACGGTGQNDEFVELYNPTNAPVTISGWHLQRRAAGGTATCWATLPAATIPANGFYLVGGAGYTASRYTNAPAADFIAATGTGITGGSESLLLISDTGSCTGGSNVVDAVSIGTITDTLGALELPPLAGSLVDGTSAERKACYDSTGDASVSTGLLAGGGHQGQGNSERVGASNADWVLRALPNPQNSATAVEVRACL